VWSLSSCLETRSTLSNEITQNCPSLPTHPRKDGSVYSDEARVTYRTQTLEGKDAYEVTEEGTRRRAQSLGHGGTPALPPDPSVLAPVSYPHALMTPAIY